MLKKITEYFETRKQIRALQQLNLIYMNNLLRTANGIVEGKVGLIELLKSFEGMKPEEIRELFVHELVNVIHANNPDTETEQVK